MNINRYKNNVQIDPDVLMSRDGLYTTIRAAI